MAAPLKAAIIGYGRVGRIRAKCLAARPQDWRLVGVSDPDRSQWNGLGVTYMENWTGLLEHHPEALFICSTNQAMPELVAGALERGIHVFCEKPPGRTLADIERMREAEQKAAGVKLKFGFNHRFHACVQEAKSIVDAGRLGKVLWVRGIYGKAGGRHFERNWRNKREISGGGILIDQGIHMLDLFRYFCGDFDEVKSMVTRSYWPIEVEDNAFGLLRNREGQVAMLHSSATQWQHRFIMDIYLEKGYLSLQGILSSSGTYGREMLKVARCHYDGEGYPLANPEESETYYDEDGSWQLEVDEFARVIRGEQEKWQGDSLDAYRSMELVQRIYASDHQWRWSQEAREELARVQAVT
ncbi:MAG: Gfo/Idh/MocA family oxidoreductase [Elusimicrobia bacterium]|nr:Gfo/Idh/MocA family oxidoreductase [Elusimicrobiota bacterium]